MVLSLMVLVSTVSFTVDSHYCGDHLVDMSLFSKAEGCGMEMTKEPAAEQIITKKSCCRNEVSFVEGLPTEQQPIQKVKIAQVYFTTAFVISYQNLLFESEKDVIVFQDLSPPIIQKDRVLLFENFRI